MMHDGKVLGVWLLVCLFVTVEFQFALGSQKNSLPNTALYDYVHTPDPNYAWEVLSTERLGSVTTYLVNMTSLQWLTSDIVDRPIWFHYMRIHIPDNVRYPGSAYLNINMLYNDYIPNFDNDVNDIAEHLGVVSAIVYQIPNQHLRFNGGRPREEDDLMAWTFREFLDDPEHDPEMLSLFPMTKAAVYAMDTVSAVVEQETGVTITNFLNTGESKRGWTTFLTAAVDERVTWMAPVVFSALNLSYNFDYHQQSLGGFSFAVLDYWHTDVLRDMNTPEMQLLMQYIDPFSYRHLYTMPKWNVKGTGDEFFLIDDMIFFQDELPSPNYLWIQENAAHELGAEFWPAMETFLLACLTDFEIPQMSWNIETGLESGTITLTTSAAPTKVSVWSAPSIFEDTRDFRATYRDDWQMVDSGTEWTESDVEQTGENAYAATFNSPDVGYTGFFIKVYFAGPDDREFIFSTEAAIVPDIIPFPACGNPCDMPVV